MSTILVFILYIIFHNVATFLQFTPSLSIISLLGATLLSYLASLVSKPTYFHRGMTVMLLIMATIASLGGNYYVIKYSTTFMYVGLLLASFIPPLFRRQPFTYEYSSKNFPEVIVNSKSFLTINLIINHLWTLLFSLAAILSSIEYSTNYANQEFWSSIIPIALQLLVGLPLTLVLPKFLQNQIPTSRIIFSSCREMFQVMPYGLDAKAAKNLNIVLQFDISGTESIKGYLSINKGTCSFSEGTHPYPNMTIHSQSHVWLDISNGVIDGSEAFLNGQYTIDGDASYLLKLNSLFPTEEKTPKKIKQKKTDSSTFSFGKIAPGTVKKALIIDGGMRSADYSKTELLARMFEKGLIDSGVQVEYLKLKSYTINDCLGCYNCWTKTPGVCIHKDDMTELLFKYRQADLLVFASPLFVFSVNAVLKRYLDRLIPILQGRIIDNNGVAHHPLRNPSDCHKGIVVISAAGFPQVNHNYEGLLSLFRNFSLHGENLTLLGELILPGAELMSVPVFSDHRKIVEDACYQAGKTVATSGYIPQNLMDKVQSLPVKRDQFIKEASMFWESFRDGKSYYQKIKPLSQD